MADRHATTVGRLLVFTHVVPALGFLPALLEFPDDLSHSLLYAFGSFAVALWWIAPWILTPRRAQPDQGGPGSIDSWAMLLLTLMGLWFAVRSVSVLLAHLLSLLSAASSSWTQGAPWIAEEAVRLALGLALVWKAPALAAWVRLRAEARPG